MKQKLCEAGRQVDAWMMEVYKVAQHFGIPAQMNCHSLTIERPSWTAHKKRKAAKELREASGC